MRPGSWAEGSDSFGCVTDAEPGFVPDGVMLRVGEGIGLRERGDREAARRRFADLWVEIGGEGGDAFHRCAIAHSMADVHDDVEDELAWDLRALEAADSLTDARVAEGGVSATVAGFYPSLHLNLGECYRKLGDVDLARDHLHRGQASLGALSDDGYSAMIRNGLERLAQALARADLAPEGHGCVVTLIACAASWSGLLHESPARWPDLVVAQLDRHGRRA